MHYPSPNLDVPKLVTSTPLHDYLTSYGLLVKREDLCAPPPWPPFSKTRGVYQYMKRLQYAGVQTFGVLDTFHSQGGLAVAAAGARRGTQVLNYFPVYAADAREPNSGEGVPLDWVQGPVALPVPPGKFVKLRPQQFEANQLGAKLIGLPAGRSAVLFHQAKRLCEAAGGHMYPNALKLDESVVETAKEVLNTIGVATKTQRAVMQEGPWIVPSSSATLASGVAMGLAQAFEKPPTLIIHLGYSRSIDAVAKYVHGRVPLSPPIEIIDEGYAYKDTARPGETPPWPCNPYYDLKSFRWWLREGRERYGQAVFWNIG